MPVFDQQHQIIRYDETRDCIIYLVNVPKMPGIKFKIFQKDGFFTKNESYMDILLLTRNIDGVEVLTVEYNLSGVYSSPYSDAIMHCLHHAIEIAKRQHNIQVEEIAFDVTDTSREQSPILATMHKLKVNWEMKQLFYVPVVFDKKCWIGAKFGQS